jgi:hypothetical protein
VSTVVRIVGKATRPGASKDKMKVTEGQSEAHAIKRIFDCKTGELVGWLYQWNTGSHVPRWKSEIHTDIFYD